MISDDRSLFLIPGMRLDVSILLENERGSRGIGYFVDPNPTTSYKGKTYNLLNGFAVEDEITGELRPSTRGRVGVEYLHKRPEKNFIYFFALSGEVGAISIVAVPIHDHSSIIQGGPAYATYFNDDEIGGL
ncbi:MAG: hypothetical protein DRO87_10300 [Candidatus Thorarchaeota archaeon]|nr:MAG: hypothetical protein DRO87_10300 [Candidatus Thorarchaeota archaeon]